MHASGTPCWFCTLIRAGDYLRLHLEPFRLFHPPKISTNAAVLLLHLSHIFWNLPIPFQTINWWLLRLDLLWPLQIDSSSIISLWGWTRSHISSRGTFDLSGAAGKKKLSKHIFSFFSFFLQGALLEICWRLKSCRSSVNEYLWTSRNPSGRLIKLFRTVFFIAAVAAH